MQFRLRTLLIVLALGPPVLAKPRTMMGREYWRGLFVRTILTLGCQNDGSSHHPERGPKMNAKRLAGVSMLLGLVASATAQEGENYKYKALSSGRFSGQSLIAADFSYSVISDASFDKAILRKATIKYAVASDAKFVGTDLQGASLKYSVMTDARFTGADCRLADFSYSLLTDADFTGADLRGAIFTSAHLGGRFDAKTIYDDTTRFPKDFDPVARGLTKK